MPETTLQEFVERKDFSRIRTSIDIPDLIEIQKRSYEEFLQFEVEPDRRKDHGLQAALASVFPIPDYNNTAILEFTSYTLGTPKYDERECLEQGMTFAVPLKLRVRLVVFDKEDKGPKKKVLDVREQEVYVGELPLMTERGTFIVNGTERVVVSQLHRSPGASFTHDKGRTHASGKVLYSARIIPYRGSWLDFEFDARDILYVRIDRRRKMPATILLKAFGFSSDDLLKMYYPVEEIRVAKGKLLRKLDPEIHQGMRCSTEVVDKSGKEPLVREGAKLTKGIIAKLKAAGVKEIPVSPNELVGRAVLSEVVDAKKNKLVEKNQRLTAEIIEKIIETEIEDFKVIFFDAATTTPVILDTLEMERTVSKEEAMVEIYRRLRPGETPSVETARALFDNLFLNSKRYDLSPVGRLKLNKKLALDLPLEQRTLTSQDIVEVIRYLVNLKMGKGEIDDIDHLGNRRVRSVGELLENQFRLGLVRMERSIKERMNLLDMETVLPHDLINAKPVVAAVKEFFSSSQLSQFMDQTNPLAEITHKRRLVGARSGRFDARARRLRSARRASLALQSYLSDRNAGRSEHRIDYVVGDLCPDQRVRIHRSPLPQGGKGSSDRSDRISRPPSRETSSSSPKPTRKWMAPVGWCLRRCRHDPAATLSRSLPTKSNTWTCRPSRWSVWRRPWCHSWNTTMRTVP